MKTTESGWYQIVIDPEDENAERLLQAAELMADSDPVPIKGGLWLAAKEFVSKVLHPVVHHYVPMKRWDQGSQRIIHTGYLICMWCPRAKEA